MQERLNIESRDENSLEDLDIQDGSVVFSNYLTIGSEEQISLSSQNSILIASNGLNLAGIVSGSGSIEVYNDMILSGALSGGLSINLSSVSNSVTLQNGYNILDTTFNGNSSDDLLILEENGTYDAQILGIGTTFQNFEAVQLSSLNDTWESEKTLSYFIDGGLGNDMFAFSSNGTYFIDDFIQITNNIIGFESYGLSTGNDIWIAQTNDNAISSSIYGRDGEDRISFENYRPNSSDIGVLYQEFEGALLENQTNSWFITDDYSQLDFIDGSSGVWTLAYTNDNGITASAISNGTTTAYYRNFNNVELTPHDDTWNITNGENSLSYIDGGTGTNTLKVTSSGSFNNSLDIGTTYINFSQLELGDNEDLWYVSTNDTNLSWIDDGGGIGYLNFGSNDTETNSISVGPNKFYRGFDAIQLGAGDDTWLASTNDLNVANVRGDSGNDKLSFEDYELDYEVFQKILSNQTISFLKK